MSSRNKNTVDVSPNKKFKLSLSPKRPRDSATSELGSPQKRLRLTVLSEEDKRILKRRSNFKIACEQVSYKDYFDYRSRFLLVYLPTCVKPTCKHLNNNKEFVKCIPHYVYDSFMVEMSNYLWHEALEVCRTCLTSTQYLSADVLKHIVQIILNAHDDNYSQFPVKHIINNCQQILMQHFSTHPPCLDKKLRNCYISFLVAPLERDAFFKKSYTKYPNGSQFECDVGIVKYCMNRLEYELSIDSIDGPLSDKDVSDVSEVVLKESVRALHMQKEKEHFGALTRIERIERLFVVLETVIELLQFDLAIAQTRFTNDQGRHRNIDKLMDCVLRCETQTGAITDNCRQILRIFTNLICLQYPESMVKTFSIWVNTVIQAYYAREIDSNVDYPNTYRYCTVFANDFHKSICDMPHEYIIRVIERIESSFMRHLVGLLHVRQILSTNKMCIIQILISFLSESQWKLYQSDSAEIKFAKKIFPSPIEVKGKEKSLFKNIILSPSTEAIECNYAKMPLDAETSTTKINLNYVVHSLYVTLEAYLDAYNIQSVHEKWTNLNQTTTVSETISSEYNNQHKNYSTTETFIKKYRGILQYMTEFADLYRDLKIREELPKVLNIFENIGFFKLYNRRSNWSDQYV